jgi:hypothetical protein
MQAGGLTKTSDTGQIDWTTVTRPTVANTNAGYEIFRLTTDAQHSTFPLYIKIEYGIGSFAGTAQWTIQTGSTTSGAGVLGGQLSTKRTFYSNSTPSTVTSYPTYSSGGDGYFCCAASWNAGTTSDQGFNQIIVIERLRDNSGSPTANGIYIFAEGSFATYSFSYAQIVRSSGLASNIISNHFACFMQDASGNFASDFYLNTHHPADRQIYNPCLSNLFYYNTDITTLTNLTVAMYGANHTYKGLGKNSIGTGAIASQWHNANFGHANSGFAILWE